MSGFPSAGGARATVYRLLDSAAAIIDGGGQACRYLAVGLLRLSDLREARQAQFRHFDVSNNEVEQGLTPFEQHVYLRWLPPGGRVLLVGCGAGRDLIGLHRAGFLATGLEQAPDLVECGRKHLVRLGIQANIELGDIESFQPADRFDAVVFAGNCYSNVHQSKIRISMLSRLASHLEADGGLIISYAGGAERSRLPFRLMSLTARLARADWRPEPGDSFTRDVRTSGFLDFFHTFLPGEVARECIAAGLHVVAEGTGTGRAEYVIVRAANDGSD